VSRSLIDLPSAGWISILHADVKMVSTSSFRLRSKSYQQKTAIDESMTVGERKSRARYKFELS